MPPSLSLTLACWPHIRCYFVCSKAKLEMEKTKQIEGHCSPLFPHSAIQEKDSERHGQILFLLKSAVLAPPLPRCLVLFRRDSLMHSSCLRSFKKAAVYPGHGAPLGKFIFQKAARQSPFAGNALPVFLGTCKVNDVNGK